MLALKLALIVLGTIALNGACAWFLVSTINDPFPYWIYRDLYSHESLDNPSPPYKEFWYHHDAK
jgi:hypothetical protein